MRSIVLFAVVVLLASGCHPKPKPVADAPPLAPSITQDDATMTPGALPPGWPDFLPAYPGASILEGSASKSNGVPMLSATLTTPADAALVHEFYGRQVSLRQFTVVSSSETHGEKVSLYRRGAQSFSVSTNREETQKLTNIELTLVGKYVEGASEASPTPPATPPAAKKDDDEKKEKPKPTVANPLLPVYPGATADPPKNSGPLASLHMSTDDPISAVCDYYEQFYAGQGYTSGGRTDLGDQSSETFSGAKGMISLNVRKGAGGGKATSINLNFRSTQ